MEKKEISDYEGLYSVTKCGKIWSHRYNKFMSQRPNKDGYSMVRLRKDSKTKELQVHRLVAKAYIPKVEGKDIVNHLNGVKDDNRVENLEWCTVGENCRHAIEAGLKPPVLGEDHGISKLSNDDVLEIDKMIKEGISNAEIGRKFGVVHQTVSNIKVGRTWGWLTGR